jgi:hypothetical protein
MTLNDYLKFAKVPNRTRYKWLKNPLKMQMEDIKRVSDANRIDARLLALDILNLPDSTGSQGVGA